MFAHFRTALIVATATLTMSLAGTASATTITGQAMMPVATGAAAGPEVKSGGLITVGRRWRGRRWHGRRWHGRRWRRGFRRFRFHFGYGPFWYGHGPYYGYRRPYYGGYYYRPFRYKCWNPYRRRFYWARYCRWGRYY